LFVDVGAHVGTWTVRAAKGFRRVMAFEPEPKWNRMLRKNVEANSLGNVEVHNVALSSDVSSEKVRSIDSYHVDPTLVKIDAEGAEYRILEGASETLRRTHPRLVVETHTQDLAKSVAEMLRNNRYNTREIVRVNRWGVPQSWLICD
jgi:precorrin-6B methylase 2